MKTVDVLQAAKAKIADKDNWAEGVIYGRRPPGRRPDQSEFVAKLSDANCFCSIGAVAAVVGLPLSEAIMNQGNIRRIGGIYANGAYTPISLDEFLKRHWPNASERELQTIERATKYLNAAARAIHFKETGFQDHTWFAYYTNDEGKHGKVIEMFDLAIKNAKRRHINGGCTAKAVAK